MACLSEEQLKQVKNYCYTALKKELEQNLNEAFNANTVKNIERSGTLFTDENEAMLSLNMNTKEDKKDTIVNNINGTSIKFDSSRQNRNGFVNLYVIIGSGCNSYFCFCCLHYNPGFYSEKNDQS